MRRVQWSGYSTINDCGLTVSETSQLCPPNTSDPCHTGDGFAISPHDTTYIRVNQAAVYAYSGFLLPYSLIRTLLSNIN
jgi:hypothetical protein